VRRILVIATRGRARFAQQSAGSEAKVCSSG